MVDENELAVGEGEVLLRDPEDLPEEWYTLDDFTVTDQIITEYKSKRIERPPNVSAARWNQPKVLNERHHAIINLTVMGIPPEKIAEEIGMHPSRVKQLLAMPLLKKPIAEKREKYFGDGRKHMQALSKKAFGVLEQILDNEVEKSAVRLDAAKYVLDQALGKAQQNIKVEGSMIVELLAKLDSTDIKDVVDATSAKILDKPKDEFDTMLDEVIPEKVVVGKRGPNEER